METHMRCIVALKTAFIFFSCLSVQSNMYNFFFEMKGTLVVVLDAMKKKSSTPCSLKQINYVLQ